MGFVEQFEKEVEKMKSDFEDSILQIRTKIEAAKQGIKDCEKKCEEYMNADSEVINVDIIEEIAKEKMKIEAYNMQIEKYMNMIEDEKENHTITNEKFKELIEKIRSEYYGKEKEAYTKLLNVLMEANAIVKEIGSMNIDVHYCEDVLRSNAMIIGNGKEFPAAFKWDFVTSDYISNPLSEHGELIGMTKHYVEKFSNVAE